MTPTQIIKLIEHYGLPEGLEYDHDDDDFYSLPCSQTQHPLPHHFGLLLLAHRIKEQREKTAYFFMQNEPVNEILTAALEIIE